MIFTESAPLTLGVEVELQLINKETFDLEPVATDLFTLTAGNEKIKPEIFQSMAEINTAICTDAHEAYNDLSQTFRAFRKAADTLGVYVATNGTHPFARYNERRIYPSERYRQLIDRNQWIARRLMIFGLHVHLGMRNGEDCIRFSNFFLHLIPHLLALSSSSPFWQGEDTGLASSRCTIFEACPTAGHPPRLANWGDFTELCSNLVSNRAISSHKDLWWDIRPSPDYGTLEIRICDGLANLSETIAIVAFIHALAHWYSQHTSYDTEVLAPLSWIMRENKWRAARHGLEADIILPNGKGIASLRQDIRNWVNLMEGQIKQLDYVPYIKTLETILARGNSSIRQRRTYEAKGSLEHVVVHNTQEFETGEPIYL